MLKKLFLVNLLGVSLLCAVSLCFAGNQREEPLSNSVKALMQKSISDLGSPKLIFASQEEGQAWLADM